MENAKGEVTNFQTRSEPYGDASSAMIWTFRLESFDADGNRLPPVPVEMRGLTAEGFINDGDKVEVYGFWREGVLVAEGARNMTTRSTVKLKGPPKWVKVFFMLFSIGVVLGFIAIMASVIAHWR